MTGAMTTAGLCVWCDFIFPTKDPFRRFCCDDHAEAWALHLEATAPDEARRQRKNANQRQYYWRVIKRSPERLAEHRRQSRDGMRRQRERGKADDLQANQS